ncbi:ATP-binding cassette domain-containing protein [Pseudooceanicola sp. CBS1P-1]|uniref:ATP-binding cassette domain-containing protein n=1 Tax=Pseudooceanicola albus TaxID=2692189 RepID=A0A6L7G3S6_9RHOB|nr:MULTISPECIES: oligopeptide/dipeptide ABC transporter ATP-binding protein [Pseudooceanicola]MBT9384986.1 ATP-binding cassette domain-containing protein [Pseudooceanicola endophyticus]MXN18020.1 ATP-binding cassette domain-containing protein [Pseudooceanicola albus]
MSAEMNALTITELSKTFPLPKPLFGKARPGVRAVRPLSLQVRKGETLGIVGESGCGKSTLARMLVGLIPPSTGQIEIAGKALDTADPAAFGRLIQYVFQDPISSLNPRKTIRQILEVPLKQLHGMDRAAREARIAEIFGSVNLRAEFLERYPHEFSGGQAQRIGIARALAAAPEILILDEPVSALDVSVQAQVLNLLGQLRRDLGLTYLFISHDLAVVEAISDRVVVLYFGAVVEVGRAEEIFNSPRHPYTRLLAESAPVVGRPLSAPEQKGSELPDPLNPPAGCAFAGRCPRATDLCRREDPALRQMGEDQLAACHHPLET